MKTRKGFTLVEAIVTIAILSIAFGLSAVAFSNLGRIQDTAAEQMAANSELDKADSLISEYISMVSVNTNSRSFSHQSHNENNLVFSSNGSNVFLSFSNRTLGYVGDGSFSEIGHSETFKHINNISFAYDDDLGLLVSTVKYSSSKTIKYSYIVRTH